MSLFVIQLNSIEVSDMIRFGHVSSQRNPVNLFCTPFLETKQIKELILSGRTCLNVYD